MARNYSGVMKTHFLSLRAHISSERLQLRYTP